MPFNVCVADKGLYQVFSRVHSLSCHALVAVERQLAKLKGQTEPITFYGRSENSSVNSTMIFVYRLQGEI